MKSKLHSWLLHFALMLALGLVALAAQAQLIDTVDVRVEGNEAVIRIQFAALIQYLRNVPANHGTAVRVYFQITAADDASAGLVEEERRAQPNPLLPPFRVVYPAQRPAVQRYIDVLFESSVDFRVQPEGNHSILVYVSLTPEQLEKLRAAKPAVVVPPPATLASPAAGRQFALPPPTVTTTPANDVERQAAVDVSEGRAALASGSNDKAVQAFNRALNLPPNAYSQEAQELVGVARERNGEFTKALIEYQLYLKLYPDGPGAARVREHLNALATPSIPLGGPMPSEAPVAQPALSYWGSVSQYYYGGQSQITATRTVVTPATDATTLDTAKISGTDQSQLVNNLDLTARYRAGDWDSRLVVRDQYVANFLANGSNKNWLNALYGETRYLPGQLMARVGRQSATSGGVLGLFDGAVGSWGFSPGFRLNAVVGQPVDNPFNTTSTFYGASVDADKMGDRFGGSAFAIRQVASGETDRLGIGGELRYFDSERNVYSMLDYDPLFRAVNIGMVQGTWQFPTLTSVNLLLDYRRAPTLQLTNALIAYPGVSLSALIGQQGVDAVRDQAKAFTPISKQTLLGVTQQVSGQWQVGLDVRWSSLSGTPPFQGQAGTPASGSVWTYTAQAIGSGLAKMQDILVVNAGYLTGNRLRAQNAGIDYRFVPLPNLTLEPLFGWYHQTDDQGGRLTRLSPGLRASYRILNRLAIEGQFNLERTSTVSNVIDDTIQRYFYYIGWRWDF